MAEYVVGISCMTFTAITVALFGMAPATFSLAQKVIAGLHVVSESYLLFSLKTANEEAGFGDTAAKTAFVHTFGLLVALATEAALFMTPAHSGEEEHHEEEVDHSGDNSTTGEETVECDPTTDPTCAAAPAAL